MVKKILKKITPVFVLDWYHLMMAFLAALIYRFPSRKLIVIGVTGTSGKSTTIGFIARIFEVAGKKAASASTVRFKIGEKEWKNNLKMAMPGRFALQKFLRQALNAGCTHVILEVTSEGIRQHRHKFINFDTAVFTNLSPEHIESHGGFENYRNEKLKLFKVTKNIHIINADDENSSYFLNIEAKKKITFGINKGDIKTEYISNNSFLVRGTRINLNLLGKFNIYNALAAISVGLSYNIPLDTCKKALEKVKLMPGRMEIVNREPLVIVDYAHTPEQLEQVYKTLSQNTKYKIQNTKLICVLGSCGGGRDKWKRPVLGSIAQKYCKEIIITNEDPYDEDPLEIMEQVASGIKNHEYHIVLDRREAIKKSLELVKKEDTVIITGKGSESLMCLANGVKVPWDDRQILREVLN